MRKEDVIELIEYSEKDLSRIKDEYNSALRQKEIPTSLRIDVKNFMENLRSAMDYIAHDVYEAAIEKYREQTSKNQVKNIYFPYGKDKNDFKSRTESNLPELELLNKKVYSIIESIQPHFCGENWLYDFCNILNEKKHERLTPQEKEERRGLKIQFPGGASITMGPGSSISGSGIIQSGGSKIVLNNDLVSGDFPAKNIYGNTEQTIMVWVAFKFSETNIEVLPLLEKAFKKIEVITKDIYNNI